MQLFHICVNSVNLTTLHMTCGEIERLVNFDVALGAVNITHFGIKLADIRARL